MSMVQTPWQLGVLRFLLGAADGALLPAVQTLLVYNSTNQIAGRIFSYNQTAQFLGVFCGSVFGGQIAAHFGIRNLFFSTSLRGTIT